MRKPCPVCGEGFLETFKSGYGGLLEHNFVYCSNCKVVFFEGW